MNERKAIPYSLEHLRCIGGNCPKKESCWRYLPFMDKTKTWHLDPVPYRVKNKDCFYYTHDPTDELIKKVNTNSL